MSSTMNKVGYTNELLEDAWLRVGTHDEGRTVYVVLRNITGDPRCPSLCMMISKHLIPGNL